MLDYKKILDFSNIEKIIQFNDIKTLMKQCINEKINNKQVLEKIKQQNSFFSRYAVKVEGFEEGLIYNIYFNEKTKQNPEIFSPTFFEIYTSFQTDVYFYTLFFEKEVDDCLVRISIENNKTPLITITKKHSSNGNIVRPIIEVVYKKINNAISQQKEEENNVLKQSYDINIVFSILYMQDKIKLLNFLLNNESISEDFKDYVLIKYDLDLNKYNGLSLIRGNILNIQTH